MPLANLPRTDIIGPGTIGLHNPIMEEFADIMAYVCYHPLSKTDLTTKGLF